MNMHRGHESRAHREAKKTVARWFASEGWSVFPEWHNTDLALIRNDDVAAFSIEVESTPRNVVPNLRRNFANGFKTVAIVVLNPKFRRQIENQVCKHLPPYRHSQVKIFDHSENVAPTIEAWFRQHGTGHVISSVSGNHHTTLNIRKERS